MRQVQKRHCGGVQWEGKRNGEGKGGYEKIKLCYIFMYGDNIKKAIKYFFLKGGRWEGFKGI
jgi:hypothetical protein